MIFLLLPKFMQQQKKSCNSLVENKGILIRANVVMVTTKMVSNLDEKSIRKVDRQTRRQFPTESPTHSVGFSNFQQNFHKRFFRRNFRQKLEVFLKKISRSLIKPTESEHEEVSSVCEERANTRRGKTKKREKRVEGEL